MQLSIFAHAFSADLAAALAAAREADFRGVVLDARVFTSLTDLSQTARREIVHILGRHEQTLVAIDVRLGNDGLSPRADLDRELDRVGRAMDVVRGLRGPLVLCDLGPLPPAPEEPTPQRPGVTPQLLGKLILPEMPAAPVRATIPRDLPFESSVENALRELGQRADRLGCLVAFRSSLGSFASLHAALSRVDCPWFGVDLDPLAMLADEWNGDAIFSALGRLVRHVRARDGVKGSGNRVAPTDIGKGQVDWRELASLCRDADYDGFATVDPIDLPNRAASATRGAAYLRDAWPFS